MKTRTFAMSLLMALVFGMTAGVTAQGNLHVEKSGMGSSADVVLASITPASFANGVNMPVTIIGTNLDTVTSAMLGTVALRNLEIISSTEVTALVPWSITPGTYDLIVKSQTGPDAILPDAVTVSTGTTDWTSNGPYGGDLYDVVVDPEHPSRVYVSAGRSGLWRSQNGGTSWDFSLVKPFPHRVQIAYPTPGQPPAMYLGGDGGMGMLRSLDYGQTWEDKTPPGVNGKKDNAFVRPGQPDLVYLSGDSNDGSGDPIDGLYKSTDLGDIWMIVNGTGGLHVSALAFDPDHPNVNMVIGTASGQIYTTTDDGITWSNPIAVANKIGQLHFAPALYNSKRGLFAIPCNFEAECDNSDTSYQSTDGGQTWTPLHVAPTPDNSNGLVFDLAFHDSIPGLMWAAVGGGFYSEDGGTSWQSVGAGLDEVHGFAVVPGSVSRQTTTLFAATKGHLYKSTDGGDTWQEADAGLGAELARTIAVSPFNAEEAYIATHEQGVLHTFDGGRSWHSLPIPIGYYDAPIAPDPVTDGKVYFGYGTNSENSPTVRVSSDHGTTFTEYAITLPPAYTGQWASVAAISLDPQTPDRLFAGVCMGSTGPGLIFASTNGGITWTKQTTPAGIKCIKRIVFDPSDPSVVYAGSNGTGVLRSTDGGATWSLLAHQSAGTQVWALEIDPRDSRSIYTAAFGGNGSDVGIFATHDGGDTWMKMTGSDYPIWELKFCRVGADYWLYAATMNGLRYLTTIPSDPSTPWEYASGIAGMATADGFNCAAEEGRVVYYIGTSGGTVATSLGVSRRLPTAAGSQNVAGGIYRSMVRIYLMYLPLIRR
jgi:photosystem II stability/assembly factor-like uncharacterized protein